MKKIAIITSLIGIGMFSGGAYADSTYKCEAKSNGVKIGINVTAKNSSDAESEARKYLKKNGISYDSISCKS